MESLNYLLSKEACFDAAQRWLDVIILGNRSVKTYIPPLSSFKITRDAYEYLIGLNQSSRFNFYMGIDESDYLIGFLVPLNADGHEIRDVDQYSICYYTSIEHPIYMIQQTISKNTKTLLINKEFEIESRRENKTSTAINAPNKTIETAFRNMQFWQNNYEDWFSLCRKNANPENLIFKYFSVLIEDLTGEFENEYIDKTHCFLGLELNDNIITQYLPNVIFIADVDEEKATIGINDLTRIKNNTFDFGRPCPPLCKGDGN